MLYGRFATILRGFSENIAGSSSSASPAITSRRPGQAAASSPSAARQRRSRSIATTRRAPDASNARVKPPGPGPISMTVAWSSRPAARAIRPVRLRSSRKFWPRRLCGTIPCRAMTSRSGGSEAVAGSDDADLAEEFSLQPPVWPPCRPPAAARQSGSPPARHRGRQSRKQFHDPARSAQRVAPASRSPRHGSRWS